MRKYGLTCDNLVGATLVTAAGETVSVSDSSQPELLWGLRGGGGNFGVATSLTYKLHPVSQVLGGLLLYRGARAGEAATAYANWVGDLPDELTTLGGFIAAPPEPFVPEDMRLQPAFAAVVCGIDADAGQPYVDQLRQVCPPDVDVVGPMPYVALQSMLDGGAPRGLRQYWKSGCLGTLDADLLEQIVAAAGNPASPFAQIHLHQLGGAVSGPARADRAISSLSDAAWVLNILGTWVDPAADSENVAWVRDLWALAEPHTVAAYTNFLGDEGADRVRSAFDDSAWRRLVSLKRQWDPDNVFRLNNNIPPV
jgi:FAD/FMN-containing dehydrogenase